MAALSGSADALVEPPLPAAPWTLHGEAIVGLKIVRSDIAQRFVPPDAKVVRIWPGRTLAILYLAHYQHSPVGEYRELIVAPALVSRHGRVGFWISNIYVDSETSMAAGRAIWALPKQMASLEWGAGGVSSVGPQLRVSASVAAAGRSMRLPFVGAAMSQCGSAKSWFSVRGSARVGHARASVEFAHGDGLAALGFGGSMKVFVCQQLRVTIGRPRHSGQ